MRLFEFFKGAPSAVKPSASLAVVLQERVMDFLRGSLLLFTGLAALLFTTATHAEWEKIFVHDDTTVYVEQSSAQSQPGTVIIRELRDCSQQREFMGSMYGFSFKSSYFTSEYNCATQQMRRLEAFWYAGQMGEGRTSFARKSPQDWTSVDEDPVSRRMLTYVCDGR